MVSIPLHLIEELIPLQQSRLACCLFNIVFSAFVEELFHKFLKYSIWILNLVMTSVLYRGSTNNIVFDDTIYLCYFVQKRMKILLCDLTCHTFTPLGFVSRYPQKSHYDKKEKLVQYNICLALRYLAGTLETHHTQNI